jgi:endonuclease YncB( thermonuclease family)
MQLRPLLIPGLLIVAGTALVAWLVIADPPAEPRSETGAAGERTTLRLKAPEQIGGLEPAAPDPAPLPSEIRNVSPEGITPPAVSGTLTRVAPSDEYMNLIDPPVEPLPDGPFDLRRPQVLDAGTLKTEDLTVRIAHVEALSADETCQSRLGGTWPCGARARTSLRGLVRMFTITCEKTTELGTDQVAAICTRRKINLGEWLVRQGWADPAEGAPEIYETLAAEARKAKRGKWQAEWLKELPEIGLDLSGETNDPDAPVPTEENILVIPPDLTLPGQSPLDSPGFDTNG